MKSIIRTIVEICLIAAVALLAYKWIQSEKEKNSYKLEKQKVYNDIQTEAREIDRKVGEDGLETVLHDITGNKIPPKRAASAGAKIIDTTAMALDIRTKQLKQVLVVKSTLEAENLLLKRKLNAANRPYYTYSGNGLDLKFTPPNDIDTNARAEFTANVNIKATQYWKRNWFLGAKKSILAVSSDNPMFKVNGADFIEIEQEQSTFGLRVQASSSYNFETGSLGFGPALRFDAGRFSFQGRYSKFPNDPKWKPSVNASFDLLRF